MHYLFCQNLYSRSYQGRSFAPCRSIPSVNNANASALSLSFVRPGSTLRGQEKQPCSKRLRHATHCPLRQSHS